MIDVTKKKGRQCFKITSDKYAMLPHTILSSFFRSFSSRVLNESYVMLISEIKILFSKFFSYSLFTTHAHVQTSEEIMLKFTLFCYIIYRKCLQTYKIQTTHYGLCWLCCVFFFSMTVTAVVYGRHFSSDLFNNFSRESTFRLWATYIMMIPSKFCTTDTVWI